MKKIEFLVNGTAHKVNYLLSKNVVKTSKGEKLGYYTGIVYLDANLSPREICPSHTSDCLASCLKSSGQLGMIMGQTALKTRTLFLLHHREEFIIRLKQEIAHLVATAHKAKLKPALRLNGSSDLPWESKNYGEIIQWAKSTFPEITLYDYTKIPGRALPTYTEKLGIPYYHLTFSWSGENKKQCEKILELGGNVAVPFDLKKSEELPATFLRKKVIDGDTHDLRFQDPRGVVVGLRYKHAFDGPNTGRKLVKRMGFIVAA